MLSGQQLMHPWDYYIVTFWFAPVIVIAVCYHLFTLTERWIERRHVSRAQSTLEQTRNYERIESEKVAARNMAYAALQESKRVAREAAEEQRQEAARLKAQRDQENKGKTQHGFARTLGGTGKTSRLIPNLENK